MRHFRFRCSVAGGLATDAAAAAVAHIGASSVADQGVAFGQTEWIAGSRSLVQELDVPSRTAASCRCRSSCVSRGCRDRCLGLDLRRAGQAWSAKCSQCRILALYTS